MLKEFCLIPCYFGMGQRKGDWESLGHQLGIGRGVPSGRGQRDSVIHDMNIVRNRKHRDRAWDERDNDRMEGNRMFEDNGMEQVVVASALVVLDFPED